MNCSKHPDRKAKARGLCEYCYKKACQSGTITVQQRQARQPELCIKCGEGKPHARGLCNICYCKSRALGTLDVETIPHDQLAFHGAFPRVRLRLTEYDIFAGAGTFMDAATVDRGSRTARRGAL